MSKEKDKILRTLEHIAITFDKLGYSPTIPIFKGHQDFEYLFKLELGTIKELCNQQDQRIAELEEQLKNAIVPKFMVGQEVWFVNEILEVIHNGKINAFEVYKFKERPYEFWYDIDYVDDNTETSDEVSDEFIFATKEQAQAKLKELQGE